MSSNPLLDFTRAKLSETLAKASSLQQEVDRIAEASTPYTTVRANTGDFMVVQGRVWTLENAERGRGILSPHVEGKNVGTEYPARAMLYLASERPMVVVMHGYHKTCFPQPPPGPPHTDCYYFPEGTLFDCERSAAGKRDDIPFVFSPHEIAVLSANDTLSLFAVQKRREGPSLTVPFPRVCGQVTPRRICRGKDSTVVLALLNTVNFYGGEPYALVARQDLPSNVLQLASGPQGVVRALCYDGAIYELESHSAPRLLGECPGAKGIYVCPVSDHVYVAL